jgi:dTDP-4-dehydrorhamnose reductase
MRVLVIGRTGQLARALADFPTDAAEMIFLGREALDLSETGRIGPVVAAHAPDLVINAAAYTAVDRAESEREAAFRINAEAVCVLARAAAERGAALIHVSTDYVFDGRAEGEYCETDPVAPLNVYGASKLAGERAALAANPRTVILRTSWVYAPWGRNFLATMLGLAERGGAIHIVADQRGKPTSALDLAAACLSITPRLAAASSGDPVWGLYHYAGAGICSWAGFAEAIFRAARPRLRTPCPEVVRIGAADYPTVALRPANSALDCSKFERVFGQRMVAWPEALDRVLVRIAAARRDAA